jgi:hypothetical protein
MEYVIPLLCNYCTATIEYNNKVKRCFLRGSCKDVTSRTRLEQLPQQETQKTDLSVQASRSTNNDTLKVANIVKQIITELSEAVSERDKIIIITIMVLNLMKQNGCWSSEAAQSHSI